MRIGHGYDVHRLVEGRDLILGGVKIPFEKGLDGHSDADVLVHAIMDALLGAAALGDIGKHFSDKDPQFCGISSLILLSRVNAMMEKNGFSIVNIDATVVLERPKISQYIDLMKENIAGCLEISVEDVNIKATTEERLGFTGKGEGAAAHAVALIFKK